MKTTLSILLTLLFIAVLVEDLLKPRLDKTSEGELLLWYGVEFRRYLKIY